MQVDAILNTKGATVHTVPVHASVRDAVSVLNAHNIGAVVVLDAAGDVAGILSERDIIRLLGRDPAGALQRPISDCMTSMVVTCTRDTEISTLMQQMTIHHVRHIPIVEDGSLRGIVSIGDVVKGRIEEAEQESSALRDYIAT